jgi:phosphoribosylglycinamide formyltransferase-1
MPVRLVVLASGGGTNLQALIDAERRGDLPARIAAVIVNQAGAGALARARSAGIDAVTLLARPGEARPDYDTRLAGVVAAYRPDWVVLAGWMRLLSMAFLHRFPNRVVNLHPALPGELPGTHAIARAHAEAVAGQRTHSGVMVHLVPDEGVDNGPVLATCTVPVSAADTLAEFEARVHAAEHRLLVDTVAALCHHPHLAEKEHSIP